MLRIKEIFTLKERKLLDKLNTPGKIQSFLDKLPYDTDDTYRSPRYVMKMKRATCFTGALFACTALAYHGYRPFLVELRAVNDDDHMLSVFKKNRCFGAVAKSNFTGLQFREPVYKSLRELVMSYFDFYFNTLGQKTLRKYSAPLDLISLGIKWMVDEKEVKKICKALNKLPHYNLLTLKMIKRLERVRGKLLNAGLLGANWKGLFKPKKE